MTAARALVLPLLLPLAVASLSGCEELMTKSDRQAIVIRMAEMERGFAAQMAQLHADLQATRNRLDTALQANAENGSDLLSEKSRLNELVGRIDETGHKLDELSSTVSAGRTELDSRLDQLTRAHAAQQPAAPPPPPVIVPEPKPDHYAAFLAAVKAKDYPLLRTLGHEYVSRYATDEKADDVLYQIGKANLDDNHPASALGEWNRLLKLFPKSNMLERTLYGMGQAYETMHDCANAKLAYGTVVAHFPKGKLAAEARARTAAVSGLPAGACAPP
jgi:TolA-binding protein